jgi:hypothetical protein
VELAGVVLRVHDHHQVAIHIQGPAERSRHDNDLHLGIEKKIIKHMRIEFKFRAAKMLNCICLYMYREVKKQIINWENILLLPLTD